MVQAQQRRDQRILDLVQTMDDTYSLVLVSADELKKHSVLQDVINQILKQTIECGYFIRDYVRHSFGGMGRVPGLCNNMIKLTTQY